MHSEITYNNDYAITIFKLNSRTWNDLFRVLKGGDAGRGGLGGPGGADGHKYYLIQEILSLKDKFDYNAQDSS